MATEDPRLTKLRLAAEAVEQATRDLNTAVQLARKAGFSVSLDQHYSEIADGGPGGFFEAKMTLNWSPHLFR